MNFNKATDGIRSKKIPVREEAADQPRQPAAELPPEEDIIIRSEDPKLPEAEKPPEIPADDDVERLERFAPSGEPWDVEQTPKTRAAWWGAAGGVAVLLISGVLISTAFARLTLTVTPRAERLAIDNIPVSFDASSSGVDPEDRKIPAELLTFERSVSADFEATGKAAVSEKARGKVRIYNNFNSAPQRLVATTRFLTESGQLYRLPAAITVPGAKIEEGKLAPQFIETEIAADKPGEDYNLSGEIRLSIPGFKGSPRYEGFYAVAPSGFEGGFVGESRVVSEEDIARAEEQVTKKAFDEIREEMTSKIPTPFRLLDAHREIQITEVSAPSPGTPADKFSAEAEALGQALVFREDDVKVLLSGLLLAGDSGRVLAGDSFRLEYESRSVDLNKGIAAASVRGEAKAKALINQRELAALLSGKKEGSLVEDLKQRPELAAFNVSFFPPWLFSAPEDPEKIKVVVEGK